MIVGIFIDLGIILAVSLCGGLTVAIACMLGLMVSDKIAACIKALRRRLA